MTYTADDLYELLPSVYRMRDAEMGYALRGLVAVLAEQADVLDADIAQLHENWFIETADRWVVPYIGDLLRVGTLSTAALEAEPGLSALARQFSQRAYVANSIGYRRRKGTAAVLEQVAVDVTGWRARAVEFFQLLATTQYVKHVRPSNTTPDVRRGAALAAIGGAFDRAARTVEVRPLEVSDTTSARRTALDRGRYNVPNVGLYLWRLQSYRTTGGAPRAADAPVDAGFTFSPLGLDAPLFNPPRTEEEISHLAQEPDVPDRLRRRALFDELEARRQALADDAPPPDGQFFRADSVAFAIRVAIAPPPAPFVAIPPERVAICDLSTWRRPAASRKYRPAGGGPDRTLPIEVGVDPELGRLAIAEGIAARPLLVDFSYGFSGDLGGGPYDRRNATQLWLEPSEVTFQLGVTRDRRSIAQATDPSKLSPDVRAAVTKWNTHASGQSRPFGLIVMMDSDTYEEDLTGLSVIEVPAGGRLAIVAADWPQDVEPGTSGTPARILGRIAADKPLRPHLRGNVSVRGMAAGAVNPGELILSGLLIDGRVTVLAGSLGRLALYDSTVVPAHGAIIVNPGAGAANENGRLRISLDRTICGPISLTAPVPGLHLGDSIVDAAGAAAAVAAPGALAHIQESTILGRVDVQRIEAGNSLFTGSLTVERRQEGCVRFCHVPDASTTPRRFRCQPDLALTDVADPDLAARIRAELAPAFTSVTYGDPAFVQLALTCARELRTGAEDGSEMGAFSSLKQPQREANLRAALDEYLRSGLDAGLFFVT